MVRTLHCHCRGRGFEPLRFRQYLPGLIEDDSPEMFNFRKDVGLSPTGGTINVGFIDESNFLLVYPHDLGHEDRHIFHDVMIPHQYRKEAPMFDVEKIVRLLLVTSVTTTTKVEAQYCLYEEKCIDRKDVHVFVNRQRALEEEICLLTTSTVPKSVLDRLGISVLTCMDVLNQAVAYTPDGKIEDALVDIHDSFIFLDEVLTAISKSELLRDHLKLAIKATLALNQGTLFADIGSTIKAIEDNVVGNNSYLQHCLGVKQICSKKIDEVLDHMSE